MPLESLGNGCFRWGTKGKKYCGPGAKKKALMQGYAENGGDEKKFKQEVNASSQIPNSEINDVIFAARYDQIALSYIPQKERDKIPLSDFGDPENRKYPVPDEAHFKAAVKLLGRAPKSKQAAIKERLKRIAKRKGYSLPKSWGKD